MMREAFSAAEDRVLILPLTRHDGEVTCQILERSAIQCAVCSDPLTLAAQIGRGIGAIVFTDAVAADPQDHRGVLKR